MAFEFRGDRAKSGNSGPRGPDGLSAYQIAVANGFVGTEAEWLASLVGADGTDGTNGIDGSAATISVASTTTLPSGSPATVTNTGTASAAALSFGIPRGEPGPAGPSRRIDATIVTTDASGNATWTFSPSFSSAPIVVPTIITTNTRQFVRITSLTTNSVTVNAYQQNATLLSLLGIDILTAGFTPLNGAPVRLVAFAPNA